MTGFYDHQILQALNDVVAYLHAIAQSLDKIERTTVLIERQIPALEANGS